MPRRSPLHPGEVARRAALALLASAAIACSVPAAPGTSSTAPTAAAYVPTAAASTVAAPRTPGTPGGEPVSSTASLPTTALPTAEFVSSDRVVARLPVEVLPEGEFSIGLSGRRELGERGMLFDYRRGGIDGPFWMKDTHIDLDIAFVDGNQVIVSIRTMRAESLEYVYSSSAYRSAIEAPAGWYAAHGVREGDSVRYAPPGTSGP